MNDYANALRNLAAQMPSIWKTDHKIRAAKTIVTNNAVHAVDQGINQFALDAALPPQPFRSQRSIDQMPVQSSNMSAALPANLTQQGGTAADQITPEHIADFVGMAYQKFGPQDQDQLCQFLRDIVDAHNSNNGEAHDQGGVHWARRGWGASGSELTSPQQSRSRSSGWGASGGELRSPHQSMSGTFAESDEAWRGQSYGQPGWAGGPPMSSATRPGNGDRGARDQRRPLGAPNRRLGGRDRRMGQDAAPVVGDFLSRFPMAGHIKFGANGR